MTKGANGTCVGEYSQYFCVCSIYWITNKWIKKKTNWEIFSTVITFFMCGLLVDIDECRDGTHQCRYNQICENTRGSYHCTCPRGYRSQGVGRPCVGMFTPLILSSQQAKHSQKLNTVQYFIKYKGLHLPLSDRWWCVKLFSCGYLLKHTAC